MKNVLTPLDFLARSAQVYRDSVAVVEGDRRFTYSEFNQRVHRLASALRRHGVLPGDRVAVLAPNTLAALEPHFGVLLGGALLVMLNIRLQAQELGWILNHCEAKVLIADPQFLPVLDPVRHELRSLSLITDDYEGLLAQGEFPCTEAPPPEEDAEICINYTSGTTGFPKGVVFTHRGAWINAIGEALEYGLSNRSVYLWTVPLFHCNGWCFSWAVTAVGGRHVLLPHVDYAHIVELIRREQVTHMCGAPVVLNALTQHCARHGIRFEHGLKIVTAGAPPSPAVLRAAEEMGAEVAHGYGLTETYGPHTVCAWKPEWDALPLAERAQLKARQGVPYVIAGTNLRVVDDRMNDVPADGKTMGEVLMRGNNVMLGYFKNPEATEEAFRGGWFHSGDIAVVHPDGYIEICDRKKDIVISGGENISSIEVEKVLYEHPAVMECAVIAVPDDKWGEVPQAHVTLKQGHNAAPDELIQFCRARLAHFKCPKKVVFGPLPKTATGKIRKAELRNAAWAGYEKKVKG
ncbi:MAG TPA: acyl--CoA ligase family protein [Terriglobales bacterium]|nr:acyl--CoA ligase family protein [Terriglobales bacterium]